MKAAVYKGSLVYNRFDNKGLQWVIFVRIHADMQDSIGLMKDKKVASKENFLGILFTWRI